MKYDYFEAAFTGRQFNQEEWDLEQDYLNCNDHTFDCHLELEGDYTELRNALNKLEPKYRNILIDRFGFNSIDPLTLAEVACKYNICMATVSVYEKEAKIRLRALMTGHCKRGHQDLLDAINGVDLEDVA